MYSTFTNTQYSNANAIQMQNRSNRTSFNDIDSKAWIAVKLFMCLTIFTEAFVSGVVIFLLKKHNFVSQALLRVLGSFATGLVLAGGLVDVLPDAMAVYARHDNKFQVPLLIMAGTIALLLVLDKCIAMLLQARKRKSDSMDGANETLLTEKPDGHAHLDTSVLSGRWYVSLVVLAGLSFHSLFEGIGMGAARTKELLLSIYTMIILHKGFVAASLAIVILNSAHVTRKRFYGLMLVFSSMSALGGVIGVVVGRLENRVLMVDVVFNCIAAGTFVYIALRELVPQFLEQSERGICADLCKLFMFSIGFIFLAGIILSITFFGT